MEKIPRYDSTDTLSWVRSESSTPVALRQLALDLFTVRGWCTLGAGALLVFCAFLFGRHELMAVGVCLVVLAILSWVLTSKLRGSTQIQRELVSAEPSVGDVVQIRLGATDPALIQEKLPEEFGPGPVLNAPGSCDYELLFGTRGIHQIGPAQQIITDSLGLIRGMVDVGDSLNVPVRSRLIDLQRIANLGEQVLVGEARASQSSTADYYDVAIRDYQQGDSIRQVHWKASARQGKLMVRQENHVATARALLILDTQAEHWCRTGADLHLVIPQGTQEDLASSPRFETALSLVSALGLRFAGNGFDLSFRDLSGTPLVSGGIASGSQESALSNFDTFHAATATLALTPNIQSSQGTELLGSELYKDLLDSRDEPVIMVLGELTVTQARWLAGLARTVRRVDLYFILTHPERYEAVQQELSRTGWNIHWLPATSGVGQMRGE